MVASERYSEGTLLCFGDVTNGLQIHSPGNGSRSENRREEDFNCQRVKHVSHHGDSRMRLVSSRLLPNVLMDVMMATAGWGIRLENPFVQLFVASENGLSTTSL